MEYNEIVTLISTLGFPIVAFGAMFWYHMKSENAWREKLDSFAVVINNNNKLLEKLLERMERDGK